MSQNYKETLLLPKTAFPMKADLVQREPARIAQWEAIRLYEKIQEARSGAPLFVLHDGPPFANGDVHMGTALNKVLKDFIVKSRAMLGFRAPYIPGWDCHGLPIEFKVVKESRGLAPAEVRRRSEEYARRYIDIQRRQFRRLGVLGDWDRPYLTLDPAYEAEVIRAFAGMVEKGLVYQAKKPVYWSTGAQTALAEAEVEYAERTDPAVYVAFRIVGGPLGGKASMVVWTTTPWTLPANAAIAVDPKAEYVAGEFGTSGFVVARALLRKFQDDTGLALSREIAVLTGAELVRTATQHPFLDRQAEVIAADFVTMETGTGQVHIAPGHGADDYLAGKEHQLPILSPVDDHGCLTEEAGLPALTGKYVFDANVDIVALLRERGALLAEHAYTHSYPHCWRSKTPIVFRAVEQFFIRIDAVRGDALKAIDAVEWLPHWGRARIRGTVEARPDWCISRQRAWGVPLPAFYDDQGVPMLDPGLIRKVADIFQTEGTNSWFERDDAWWAAAVGVPPETKRHTDTLDVWIDSGVSHQAVTAKRPELAATGGVADVYLEATDQHRGWFQSSLLTSVALNGRAPYKTVITHGFVVDKDTRKKISKSAQGSYQKPMEAEFFVGKYGADVVRLWAASVQFTDDVPFSEETFTRISEAYRSFRNVLRILLANLHDYSVADASLEGATTVDRWILSRLQSVVAECRAGYETFDFRKVFETLNQFCTVELSALYVDITKDRMYCDRADSPRRRATQTVMHACFEAITRLLAPILAFTSDEAWEFSGRIASIHIETFPQPDESRRDLKVEGEVVEWLRMRALVYQQAVEPARQQKLIGNALEASVTLAVPAAHARELEAQKDELEEFFILSDLTLTEGREAGAQLARTPHAKCPRCWRHRASVGLNATQPELCARCAEVCSA